MTAMTTNLPATGDQAVVEEPVGYLRLQREHGGRYVALRGGEVIASATTYEALSEQVRQADARGDEIVIEYVESPDLASAY